MKRKNESRNTNHEPTPLTNGLGESRIRAGSALILVVVLTSLLAIVGVMFVMVARVDRIATSAISENKTLDSAVEAVIAKISQELVLDVPGVGGQPDYYDYPGQRDAWLASLEPHKDGTDYKWRQISDVTGYINQEWGSSSQEKVTAEIVGDHEEIKLESDGDLEEQLADADGDGVADSKWIELDDITSSKGKPIYAAIRVIDNGGMLNVNTAYQFNSASPGTDGEYIDGSEQMQINLMALSWRPGTTSYNPSDETDLLEARANNGSGGLDPLDLDEYEKNVVWRYNEPNGPYTPFDISDDLELRNRFLLNHTDIDTRLEAWGGEFRNDTLSTPVTSGGQELDKWFKRAYDDGSLDPNYAYRHIGTTYNMDRIINPYGGKMVNVNKAGAGSIYNAIKAALFIADPNFKDIDEIAAQTAVNLVDFRDNNSDVTPLPDVNGITYYGFERPCVYISELAHRFQITEAGGGPVGSDTWRSYAVELCKPYPEDDYPDSNEWRLFIDNSAASPSGNVDVPVDWSGTQRFHVIKWENIHTELDVDFDSDPLALSDDIYNLYNKIFDKDSIISLQRRVDDVNDIWVSVDSHVVPGLSSSDWLVANDGTAVSIQRDITLHKCIRRLWADAVEASFPTLGQHNNYPPAPDPDPYMIQAHPEDKPFTNVGEIGMVFREDVYSRTWNSTDTEADVRLNLADPNYHNIFKYLTVFDPSSDGIDNDGDGYGEAEIDSSELKIPGRININTAPWYVIAQLPWVSDKLAQAIVAYRDKLETPVDYSDPNAGNTGRYDVIKNKIPSWVDQDDIREELGFASIGELAFVLSGGKDEYNEYSIDRLSKDGNDLAGFPDLTPGDDAADDFEERDVIFARLSNLVTVRSDVFTAYILVRIGADGPQKRVMAILDRSNVYPPEGGKVRIVALHAVADPR